MGRMRNKVLGLMAAAFVASLGVGALTCNEMIAVNADEAPVFAMVEGAQVRTENPAGIRFVTDVNDAYKAALAESYPTTEYTWVWGTVLTFTDAAGTAQTIDAKTKQWIENDTRWYTALVDIPATDYLTEITAESYVKVYAANDAETVVYSDTVSNAQTRSIAWTASWAMNDGYTDEILSTYVSAVAEKSVTLDKEGMGTLFLGDELQLGATVSPAGYGVVWSSDNEDIATVDKNGNVTAVGSGVATITASFGDATDSYQVEVIAESDLITGLSKTNGQWTNQNGEVGQVLIENNVVGNKSDVYGIDPMERNSSNTMFMRLDKEVMGKLFADTTVNAITFDIILSTGTAKIQRGNNAETLTTTSTNIGTYTDGENSYYSYSVTVTRWHYEKYAQTADLILRYTGGGASIFFFVDNIATVEDYTTALYEDKLVTEFANKTSSDRTLQTLVKTNTLGDENDVYGVAKIVAPKSATMYLTISYAYLQELFANTKVTAITFDIILDQEKKLQLAGKDFSACTGNPSFITEEVKIGDKSYYVHTVTLTRAYFASISKDVALRYIYHKDESGVNHYTAEPTCMYVDNLALVK